MWGEIEEKKKKNLPVLTQPKQMSAKGSYYTASWSMKLCGTGFLMLINSDMVGCWCSVLLSWYIQTAVPELFLSCGAKPSVPLGSGVGLLHPYVLLFLH